MSDDSAVYEDGQQLEQKLKSLAPAVKKLLRQNDGEQAALALLASEGIDQEIAVGFVEYIRDIFKIELNIGQSPGSAEKTTVRAAVEQPRPSPTAHTATADSVFDRPAHIAQRTPTGQIPDPEPQTAAAQEPEQPVEQQPQLPLEPQQEIAPAPLRRNLRNANEKLDEVSKLKANVRSILKNPRIPKR